MDDDTPDLNAAAERIEKIAEQGRHLVPHEARYIADLLRGAERRVRELKTKLNAAGAVVVGQSERIRQVEAALADWKHCYPPCKWDV